MGQFVLERSGHDPVWSSRRSASACPTATKYSGFSLPRGDSWGAAKSIKFNVTYAKTLFWVERLDQMKLELLPDLLKNKNMLFLATTYGYLFNYKSNNKKELRTIIDLSFSCISLIHVPTMIFVVYIYFKILNTWQRHQHKPCISYFSQFKSIFIKPLRREVTIHIHMITSSSLEYTLRLLFKSLPGEQSRWY
jgi:hypothetical protein